MANGNHQGRQMMMLGAPPLPTLWTRLPVGGWQVGFWVDETGCTLVDVADPVGTLAYRLAGSRRASLSVETGWSGSGFGPDGRVYHWALAVGRLPTGLGHTLSFVSCDGRDEVALVPDGLTGLRITDAGLWVAAAIGRYSHVRLTVHTTELQHRLIPAAG
jgi:hypothetical protein